MLKFGFPRRHLSTGFKGSAKRQARIVLLKKEWKTFLFTHNGSADMVDKWGNVKDFTSMDATTGFALVANLQEMNLVQEHPLNHFSHPRFYQS